MTSAHWEAGRENVSNLTFIANITDIEYTASLFDHILNSTDYDLRMRPTPGGLNKSVEVPLLQQNLPLFTYLFLGQEQHVCILSW